MTNGEKLISDFPYIEIKGQDEVFTTIQIDTKGSGTPIIVYTDWWNSEYNEPTTKNNLGVDYVDRQAAITFVCKNTKEILKDTKPLEVKLSDDYLYENVAKIMRNPKVLPSVTPQEPFINKPCISDKQCEHDKNVVLDKIRAELHATAEMHSDGDHYLREEWIDEITDKYMECEDKE